MDDTASNLARLRIAADVLRVLIPQDEEEKKAFAQLAATTYKFVQKYEGKMGL